MSFRSRNKPKIKALQKRRVRRKEKVSKAYHDTMLGRAANRDWGNGLAK